MGGKNNTKGLAGLSSMVTDVHAIEQQAKIQVERTQTPVHDEDTPQTPQSSAKTSIDQSPQYQQELSNRRKNAQRRDRLIAIGIGLALLLFILFKVSGGKSGISSRSHQTRSDAINQALSPSTNNPPPKNLSPQAEYLLRGIQQSLVPKKGVITGYDDNHPYLNDNGLCEITIDNTKNNMPVYVRIWDMQQHKPVRAFYIRQRYHQLSGVPGQWKRQSSPHPPWESEILRWRYSRTPRFSAPFPPPEQGRSGSRRPAGPDLPP